MVERIPFAVGAVVGAVMLALLLALPGASGDAVTSAGGSVETAKRGPAQAARIRLLGAREGLRRGRARMTVRRSAGPRTSARVNLRTRPLRGVRGVTVAVDGRPVSRRALRGRAFTGIRASIAATRLARARRVSVILRRGGRRPLVFRRRAPRIAVPGPGRLGSPAPKRGSVTPAPRPRTDAPPSRTVPPGGQASPPQAGDPPPPAEEQSPPPSSAREPGSILWGAWIDGDAYGPAYDDPPWDMDALSVFESTAGKDVSMVHYGQFWRSSGVLQPFYPNDHQRVRDRGAIPVLDWNPWDSQGGASPTQPDFALARITGGDFDAYITEWAEDARDWGHPLFLRFAHEMNGDWYPWSEVRNGNAPGEYVAAWRHVHGIFESVGAGNVIWVWSPNAAYPGSLPLAGLYPGDAYVDWVAIDGYNWGTNPSRPDVWRSFADVIRPTYDELATLAPDKPVMIAETGSSEHGGSKAEWIAEALSDVRTEMPRIRAFLWFNWDAEADWSIETSASASAAFAAGIGDPAFAGSDFGDLSGDPLG